jgi:urease accessory protein
MLNHSSLLRLLQLASPSLPVGAYSYSEGLETLVEIGKVKDGDSLEHWLSQELAYGAVRLEAAVMVRAYGAVLAGDGATLAFWNHWLSAARETEELRSQSWQMGRSLMRLLLDLSPDWTNTLDLGTLQKDGCNFAVAYAIAAATWQIDQPVALLGYLYTWANNLVNAGIKLIPLGQTTGQKLLVALHPRIEHACEEIAQLPTEELGTCGWGLALASMAHETQYSRLFRS